MELQEDVTVTNYVMTEILENRAAPVVIAAVARMVSRLTYLGFTVRRIHSDRAKELCGKPMMKWAIQIGTLSEHSLPAMIGREREEQKAQSAKFAVLPTWS